MAVKKGLIPKEIATRRKQGFAPSMGLWMQNEWKEIAEQVLDPVVSRNYTGIFDPRYVQSVLTQPYLNSNEIFCMMTFVIWHRIYIDNENIHLL